MSHYFAFSLEKDPTHELVGLVLFLLRKIPHMNLLLWISARLEAEKLDWDTRLLNWRKR